MKNSPDLTKSTNPDESYCHPSLYGDMFIGLYGLIYGVRWGRLSFILLACIAWACLLGAAYLWGAR